MSDANAAIARWMGEYFDKAIRDFHGSDCGRAYAGPDYLHDDTAALRVLAEMELRSNFRGWYLSPDIDSGGWMCGLHPLEKTGDTPAAAICAAWLAEFGQPRDGGKE